MIRGKSGKQFEQLSMLDPKEGTGMWDDPTNGPVRRQHIAKMMGKKSLTGLSEKESKAAQSLDRSQVPLQHIGDLSRAGISIKMNDTLLANGMYTPKTGRPVTATDRLFGNDGGGRIELNSTSPTTVVHEAGHALHDVKVNEFSPQEITRRKRSTESVPMKVLGVDIGTVSPTMEGVATGYSSRYAGRPDRAYRRIMRKAGSPYFDRFSEMNQAVQESGQVPFTYKDQPLKSKAYKPDRGEQLGLGI
jgi:hypothetical protein